MLFPSDRKTLILFYESEKFLLRNTGLENTLVNISFIAIEIKYNYKKDFWSNKPPEYPSLRSEGTVPTLR